MKIYNKRKFISGMTSIIIAITLIILSLINIHNRNMIKVVKHIICAVILLSIGITAIYRSLDKKRTKEDIIEENDERNKMLEMKAKSTAFFIVLAISYILTMCAIVLFSFTKDMFAAGILVGIGVVPGIMLITGLAVTIYYNIHD